MKNAPTSRGIEYASWSSAQKLVFSAEAAVVAAEVGALFAGTRLIDHQVFAQEVGTVQACDSLAGGAIVGHLNKAKPAAALGDFVHDDFGGRYFPERGKVSFELIFRGFPGNVGNINVHRTTVEIS
jgi:hypothetical protein